MTTTFTNLYAVQTPKGFSCKQKTMNNAKRANNWTLFTNTKEKKRVTALATIRNVTTRASKI